MKMNRARRTCRQWGWCWAIVAAVCLLCPVDSAFAADAPHARLGVNIAGPSDWNTELPLVDVFCHSRTWISQRKGEKWGTGPAIDLDGHGWVKRLGPDCYAETPLCTIEGGHYPAGQYVVFYQGKGRIDFKGSASVVQRGDGRIVIDVTPQKGTIWLRIAATDPTDYLRNIRVIMPGFEATYKMEPWHPDFLARWQGFACLRFMDLMKTNSSKVATWSDRPHMNDATWTTKGWPLEMLVALANRQAIDPWFCMPHLADDDYIRRFAQQVKQLLAANRKVYIEYSNEVWNSQFAQHKYAAAQGIRRGYAKKPREAAWYFTAQRSKEIFAIWEDVFGGTDRLVRVLPTQAANAYLSRHLVKYGDAYKHADVLAIAPYFGWNIDKAHANGVVAGGLEGVLQHMETVSLPQSIQWIRKQKQIADAHGLKLICYEAGQHLVGHGEGAKNKALTKLLTQANGHQRMGAAYKHYFDAWQAEGGDLMAVFSSVTKWGRSGSWGLMEYAGDDPFASPKMRATLEWAASRGQPVLTKVQASPIKPIKSR